MTAMDSNIQTTGFISGGAVIGKPTNPTLRQVKRPSINPMNRQGVPGHLTLPDVVRRRREDETA